MTGSEHVKPPIRHRVTVDIDKDLKRRLDHILPGHGVRKQLLSLVMEKVILWIEADPNIAIAAIMANALTIEDIITSKRKDKDIT